MWRRAAPPRRCAASGSRLSSVPPKWAAAHRRPGQRDAHVASATGLEGELLAQQGAKSFSNQAPLASLIPLRPAGGGGIIDVCVVGAGPAGLSLAAELGLQGLQVALVAPDSPFINTHACWLDELDGLSLDHTFNTRWESAVCYFKETPQPTRLPRPYIRFSRHKLRAHLAERCAAAGVRYAAGEVADIDSSRQASEGWVEVRVAAAGAAAPVGVIRARMAVVAAGAAGTRYIKYEARSPPAAIQSAYGIYAELEGYERWCDPSAMNFQDFRMEYGGTQAAGPIFDPRTDTPSFLYAMPLADKRVLLEETCLGAMTPLTFGELKGRLERRMAAMGIRVTRLLEEEWLTIPMGGPLPLGRQPLMAFGATARLLHPSTGYSVARSLQAAPPLARQIAGALAAGVASEQATHQAWQVLWPADARRQAAFQVYGMQLIAGLKMRDMVAFFAGFYTLPTEYWHGYVSHTVSGAQLLLFAFMMSWKLPLITQASMLRHVLTDASTLYLLQTYLTAAVASNIAQPSAPAAAAPGGAAGRS